MFEKIAELLSKKSLLDISMAECKEMLEIDLQMFTEAQETLRKGPDKEAKLDIYNYDKKVNKLERSVRKKILTHLAVGSKLDLNRALILTSIVIDLERIGDYTKNMYELAIIKNGQLNPSKWSEKLDQIEADIVKSFSTLIGLFSTLNPDKVIAEEVIEQLLHYTKIFDDNIAEIIRGEVSDLSPSDAAVLVLYMRYLKRISAHLRNVATGIVNPMHRIGFKVKKKHREQAQTDQAE